MSGAGSPPDKIATAAVGHPALPGAHE